MTNECEYAEVECSWQGCDIKVVRFQLAEHEASCEQREVSCEKCEERVKVSAMSDHALGCKGVDIECPQECGTRVLRGELGEHEKECPNAVVSCSFAEHGCSVREKRKKISQHEEEAAVAHSRLAARRAGRERERNAMLEKEVAELKQTLAQKETELTQVVVQRTSEVRKLEEELEESKRRVATLDQQRYGEASVTWEIEDFTEKAKKKALFKSNVFHVQTKAGAYHLRLSGQFIRKAGSTRRGYVGLFVRHDSAHGGSANFPVSLKGTELTVAKGARKATKNFGRADQLERDSSLGLRNMLSTDKLPGLRWTDEDVAAEDVEGRKEPEYDVTDLLEDDTLTVKGTIRVTPPKEIDI